jgi:hypothetical protein
MFRDLRLRRVGEPRRRSDREHATLSLGRAAADYLLGLARITDDRAGEVLRLTDVRYDHDVRNDLILAVQRLRYVLDARNILIRETRGLWQALGRSVLESAE